MKSAIERGETLNSTRLRRVAVVVGILLLAVVVVPVGATASSELRAVADGSVIDFGPDGTPEGIHDGLGSVIVGFNAHFGPGEYRGVYEFDLSAVQPCAAGFAARLRLIFAGTFEPGPGAPGDPNLTLYGGVGDGSIDLADFGAGSLQASFLAYDSPIDVTALVNSLVASAESGASFVARPNPDSAAVSGAFLFSSTEISDAYGFAPTVLEVDCARFMTAPEQINALISLVDTYQLTKLGTSLEDKLGNAERLLSAGKETEAKDNLQSFINQVEAQRGKALTEDQTDTLSRVAQRILNVI
jgi:hypothetical protein